MTNQENQLNQLIQRIMMIQQVENWSWFFCKVPQVYWVLFRYLPELTGPKLSFTRSRRHDEPAEPIESTHTLQIVLQNSAQSWEKSDILQLKKSTLINSHYMCMSSTFEETPLAHSFFKNIFSGQWLTESTLWFTSKPCRFFHWVMSQWSGLYGYVALTGNGWHAIILQARQKLIFTLLAPKQKSAVSPSIFD